MVFNEAINQLKTQFNWIEFEAYLNNGAFPKFVGTTRLLDPSTTGNKTYDHDHDDGTLNATAPIPIFAFSSDQTYGWLAGIQRVPGLSKCYKFWIFIVREPTGVLTNNNFKLSFLTFDSMKINLTTPAQVNNRLDFLLNTLATTERVPSPSAYFLANNNVVYQVNEVGEPNTSAKRQTILCDNQISNGYPKDSNAPPTALPNVRKIAFPYAAAGVTRKVPTVAVFQVIISY
jgi:hypothetical protein